MWLLAQQGLQIWFDRAKPSDVQDVFVWALIAAAIGYVVLQISKWAVVLRAQACGCPLRAWQVRDRQLDQSDASQQLTSLSAGLSESFHRR